MSLQPGDLNLYTFKLWFFKLTKFIVWNIKFSVSENLIVCAVWVCCLGLLFGCAVWVCCLSVLFWYAVWVCCLSVLFEFAVWVCCWGVCVYCVCCVYVNSKIKGENNHCPSLFRTMEYNSRNRLQGIGFKE